MWTEHRLISFDETPIFYRHALTEGAPKAVVILVHGMGEHGGRYARLVDYLAAMGIESYTPDLRGFGQSGGKRAFVKSFSEFHEDLGVLHRFVARTHKDLPLFIIGHSFGGLVVSSYAAFCKCPNLSGLVLSSPIFDVGIPILWWRHVLGVVASIVSPDYAQGTGVKPETLTHDPEILRRYGEDKLIYRQITARLYCELQAMISKNRQIASRVKVPTLIVQAGEDAVVSVKATRTFYDNLSSEDREIEIYPDFFHEIFNEVGRERVFSRVGQWVLKRSRPN